MQCMMLDEEDSQWVALQKEMDLVGLHAHHPLSQVRSLCEDTSFLLFAPDRASIAREEGRIRVVWDARW